MSTPSRQQPAFVFVELLIVIAIIAVIAVLIALQVTKVQGRARNVRVKNDVSALGTAVDVFRQSNGKLLVEQHATTTLADYNSSDPTLLSASNNKFMFNKNLLVAGGSPEVPHDFPVGNYVWRSDYGSRLIQDNHMGDLFTGLESFTSYPLKLVNPPVSNFAYAYEYRSSAPVNGPLTGGSHDAIDDASQHYAVITNLDIAQDNVPQYFWVYDGAVGSSNNQADIPIPGK